MVGRQHRSSRSSSPVPGRCDVRVAQDARGLADHRCQRRVVRGTQFVVSNLIGPELADLLAAIVGVVAVVALLAVWSPARSGLPKRAPRGGEGVVRAPPLGATLLAWSPFIIIVAIFLVAQIEPMKST